MLSYPSVNVLGGGLEKVFGFEDAVPSRGRFTLRFLDPPLEGGIPASDRETSLRLGNPEKSGEALGTYGYTRPIESPIAVYEDGTAAITHRSFGNGNAIAVGLDLGDFLLRGFSQRAETLFRGYVNEYDPASDILMAWLGRVFRENEADAVTLGTVPDGRAFSLLLTHDIDAGPSLKNSLEYARYEKSQGMRGTYFIQTKYLKDWNDAIFLDEEGARDLAALNALGMELGSHSVCHSDVFNTFPLGTGAERYPDYRPFVKDQKTAIGGSVLGELRVSKFLIETLGKAPVVSFRPGHLSNPTCLPQTLWATGHSYCSTVTANESLTHLPFQLNADRDFRAEVPVFEFPITVEDEFPPLTEDRVSAAIELTERIERVGGLYVLLIHTNETGPKLEFEKRLVEAVKEKAWTGSIRDFGDWWVARNAVSADVVPAGRRKTLELTAPLEIEGLSVRVPSRWEWTGSDPVDCATPSGAGVVFLKKIQGTVTLFFRDR